MVEPTVDQRRQDTDTDRSDARDAVGAATLDLLEQHDGYSRWIWERLRGLGDFGGKVLEVGCGIGTFTRWVLAEPSVTLLHSVDVDDGYVAKLRGEVKDSRFDAFCSPAEAFQPPAIPYDCAISSNVFEHIEDDARAMRMVADALRPGGEFRILVPAHPALYCPLDEGLSHYRRYTRARLLRIAAEAGLSTERIVSFNPVGAFGWWVNGTLLRRRALPVDQVSVYDRFGVTVSRWFDRLNPLPVGISLIARLRKR